MTDFDNVELANTSTGIRADIENLSSGKSTVFSTFSGADHATKVAVLNAMTNSEPVADHIGETIQLENVIVQAVDMTDEKTGEVQAQPRIILVDNQGQAYHAFPADCLSRSKTSLVFSVIRRRGRNRFRLSWIR